MSAPGSDYYRHTVMEKADLRRAWKGFRRLRLIFLGLLVTCVPIPFLAIIVSFKLFKTPVLGFVVFGAWILTLAFYGFRLLLWPCPLCANPFAGRWGLFTRQCPHCGLSIREEP
jgi:hypothetical protein